MKTNLRRRLLLQPNLIVNGEFAIDASGWTDSSAAGGAIAWNSANQLDLVNTTGTARADQSFSTESGKTYRLVFANNAVATAYHVGTSQGGQQHIGASTLINNTFTATTTTTWIRFYNDSAGTTKSIAHVSVVLA